MINLLVPFKTLGRRVEREERRGETRPLYGQNQLDKQATLSTLLENLNVQLANQSICIQSKMKRDRRKEEEELRSWDPENSLFPPLLNRIELCTSKMSLT